MVNAWRNAPIQGGVADIMLAAYAELHRRLAAIPSAWPVQTVHDSVVIECDRADAAQVVNEVRESLETASLEFCPDVTPKADIDIRTSLADADIVEEDTDARDEGVAGTALGDAVTLDPLDDEGHPVELPDEPVQLQLGLA